MKRLLLVLVAVVATLASGVRAGAQGTERGAIPNPLLQANKSGKIALTKGRWTDYVGRGKYTLVHLWTPRDEEGAAVAADVEAVYRKYRDKGLIALGVPIGDELDLSTDVMREWGLTYPQLVDVDEEPSGRFEFGSLPYVVLLGPDGKIVAENLRGSEMETTVKAWLSGN